MVYQAGNNGGKSWKSLVPWDENPWFPRRFQDMSEAWFIMV
jgi:hypothetical protein